MPDLPASAQQLGQRWVQPATQWLQALIRTPSFSREEAQTAELLAGFLAEQGIAAHRHLNNVWAQNLHYDATKPTLLLNSHHDTVRPNAGYTRDPFAPDIVAGKLYGLGSNDAGGCLVALLAAFCALYARADLPYNLIFAASAEEEVSGHQGIAALREVLPPIACGIVGEPTSLQMAVAEKGLMVLDGRVRGQAGHAAREEGINALYRAVDVIAWLRAYAFDKTSSTLGAVKLSVTQVAAGTQHNVVPEVCTFVVDVRTTDAYSNAETLDILQAACARQFDFPVELVARSTRLNPSGLPQTHPLFRAGQLLGLPHYGSPTLSDQALMSFPTLKLGPGESARSHTADEYILLEELAAGIATYVAIIQAMQTMQHKC